MRVILLMFIPFLLYAQNLKELIALSFKNENIRSSELSVEASQMAKESISTSHYPQLNVGSSYTSTKNESMGNPSANSVTYAKASMSLYDGGNQSARVKQKSSSLNASRYKLQNNKNLTALNVIRNYFSIITVQESKKSYGQKLLQVDEQVKRLEKFYDAGLVFIDEVEKMRAAYQGVKADIASQELQEQELTLDLAWLTNSDVNLSFGAKIKEVQESSSHERSDIKALSEQSDAEFENIAIQKSSSLPQVNIENTYSKSSYDYEKASNDVMKMPEIQNKATISVNWRVFDFDTNAKKVEESRLNYEISKLNLTSQKRAATLELENAKKAIEIAKVKIEATEARVVSADKTFEIIYQKYKNGIVDNIAYLDALTQKFEAYSQNIGAKNDLEIKKAQYYYYGGIDIMEMIE